MAEAFGSTCHGAGRNLSRHAAIRALAGVDVAAELARQGILVRAERRDLLAEEASLAYKDVDAVVSTARARPGLVRRWRGSGRWRSSRGERGTRAEPRRRVARPDRSFGSGRARRACHPRGRRSS